MGNGLIPKICFWFILQWISSSRFTTELAKRAESVTAVDFMESYIKMNMETNKNFKNIDYCTGDVTEISLPENTYDVIFSNWLLMYLDNKEVEKLVVRMLSWLKSDGHLFVRESCFRPSGILRNEFYFHLPLFLINRELI